MTLTNLEGLVKNHSGEFVCEQINNKGTTKIIPFKHLYDPPITSPEVPKIEKLPEFYMTFGRLVLYYDEKSGDAAVYIANPNEWEGLRERFCSWLEDLDEDEKSDLLPAWIENYLVIGEIPRSGNFLLVPTTGKAAGHIFEFEHDGFEFIELAEDIEEYVNTMIHPDSRTLTNMASHMRFIEDDPMIQWWIRELRDNKNNVVTTRA